MAELGVRVVVTALGDQHGSVFQKAIRIIAGIVDRHNHERLHASLSYLRPIEVYRGDPEALLAERRLGWRSRYRRRMAQAIPMHPHLKCTTGFRGQRPNLSRIF